MKKYALLLLLFFLFILCFKNSYSYVECNNMVDDPKEVTTLNLQSYLNELNYKELYYLCSYDYCYNVRSSNIDDIINDFKNLLDSNTLNEDKLITNVKGYSVTKIGFNGCKVSVEYVGD